MSAIAVKKSPMLVVTEGSTDWKHMLAAYNKLNTNPENQLVFTNLQFEFLQYEPTSSKTDCDSKLEMGCSSLCSLCQSYSKLMQQRKMVFIADCDDRETNRRLSETGRRFKAWGNNVYSLILPVPENRQATPQICIEHMYSDDTIKTEVFDSNTEISRRLYMGNEFDKRGISASMGLICERKGICGEDSIAIIEGSSGERVTSISNGSVNLALPKMEFANMILNCKFPFEDVDFDNFLELFSILKEISSEGE